MAGQKKRGRPCPAGPWTLALVALCGGLLGAPAEAAPTQKRAVAADSAPREHTVRQGQTLAQIAQRYGVDVSSLAAANGLRRSGGVRVGQVLRVPPAGLVYASAGDTLSGLARRHGTTTAELARVNRLGSGAALREGQALRLPGHEAALRERSAEQRWGRPKRPGQVSLVRAATHQKRTLQLVDARGRVPPSSLRAMTSLLRPRGQRRGKAPHPRLLQLVAQISDHFGGRPIQVISGYRLPGGATRESSRHVAAQAMDFRVTGVPLDALRDYCHTLDYVGVGYYPNSGFVHLDVRRKSARWTDLAGRGEAARLVRPGDEVEGDEAPEAEPTAEDDGQEPVDPAPDTDPPAASDTGDDRG